MACLVIGAGGLLGTRVTRALRSRGHSVTGLDVAAPSDDSGAWLQGDLRDERVIVPLLQRHQVVLHFAGGTHPDRRGTRPPDDVALHIGGTVQLLEHASRAGVRRVVYASSGGLVYGRASGAALHEDAPLSPVASQGIAKLSTERYLAWYREHEGLDSVVLRIANPYGSSMGRGVIDSFLAAARHRRTADVWGGLEQVRDYVHVDDVADAVACAAVHDGEERLFNIGTGIGTSTGEVLDAITRVTGRALHTRQLPGRPTDVAWNVLDVRRAEHALGWTASTCLDTGIEAAWAALRP